MTITHESLNHIELVVNGKMVNIVIPKLQHQLYEVYIDFKFDNAFYTEEAAMNYAKSL